jgi:hypothetical protein
MNLCKRYPGPRAIGGKTARGRENSKTSVAAEINIFSLMAYVTNFRQIIAKTSSCEALYDVVSKVTDVRNFPHKYS